MMVGLPHPGLPFEAGLVAVGSLLAFAVAAVAAVAVVAAAVAELGSVAASAIISKTKDNAETDHDSRSSCTAACGV